MNAKLTAKETALMTAVADQFFSFFDEGIVEGGGIWANTMNEEILGSKYEVSSTQRGAASVMNSLVRKGLFASELGDTEDGAWVYLTAEGAAWCAEHNAEAPIDAPAAAEEAPATETPAAAPAAAEAPAAATEGELPAIGEALKYKDGETCTFISLSKDALCYRVKDAAGKASYKRISSFI